MTSPRPISTPTPIANVTELGRDAALWRRWGPYLSERQWGTVREDYSDRGEAWEYLSHDQARARAYRWGEDGIAGISDEQQRVCLAVALWNGADPILKERLFGLTNREGNHGEDVKENYYYLDATPTHTYLKMLYKYPHAAFPYARLVDENRGRPVEHPELELTDTGVFDDGRYFDVIIEWAKAAPEDLLLAITVHNRGPIVHPIHVLPHLWLRNTWSWGRESKQGDLRLESAAIVLDHESLGRRVFFAEDGAEALFTDNETNPRIWGVESSGHYKDAFHEHVVQGRRDALCAEGHGTKAAWHVVRDVPAGGEVTLRFRFTPQERTKAFDDFDAILEARREEADVYYGRLQAHVEDPEARRTQRQALAGMIWSKQFYCYDVRDWLHGDPAQPLPPAERRRGRNADWAHLNNADILSMPDKWEYPWYAAWDLAFHCLPLALVDCELAKSQLVLLTREWYMHPNGQLPAYEWAFGDVNPPVHAWAAWKIYDLDRRKNGGVGDTAFLERVFHKLMLNFTWWVNRKDASGRNIFQGGFLGLDNIGVFDRSAPLPTGGHIDQADGTAWMAAYALHLMRIALELAAHDGVYEDIATKFFEHFLYIAEAMTNMAGRGYGLWNEEDGFFYDVLNLPDGKMFPLKVRSIVGLLPLIAVEVIEPELLERVPGFAERLRWFLSYRPDLARLVSRWEEPGRGERRLLSLLRGSRMKKLLQRMLASEEFLSAYGVRALSKFHETNPYVFDHGGTSSAVSYEPGESTTRLFGGNSNWRGPIWFPVNYLLIDALREFHRYYGDEFRVECPTGSGQYLSLAEIANDLSRRLVSIFLPDANGRRPVFGHDARMQNDPRFRDHLLFYEYFHGDSGRGVGASHQTGWTGLVATLIDEKS